MKETVVADSACLIALERIGRLDLLTALFNSIMIPPEVQNEFGISLPWLKIEAPANQSLILALKMDVDDGEAEAIALAIERGLRIILDDRQARSVAKHMGVSVIGTVGILVKAKMEGIIPALKPVIVELEATGFFMTAELKEEALRLAGE